MIKCNKTSHKWFPLEISSLSIFLKRALSKGRDFFIKRFYTSHARAHKLTGTHAHIRPCSLT